MIRLCSGSVFKVISLGKENISKSDDDLAHQLYSIETDYSYIPQVKACNKNLPGYFLDTFRWENRKDFVQIQTERCKEALRLYTDNSKKLIALVLIDIIKKDETIDEEQILGENDQYTKARFKSEASHALYLPDFLANLILYTASNNDNRKGKEGIEEVNEDFFHSFREKSESIVLLNSVYTAPVPCPEYALDPAFSRYMDEKFSWYKEKNIEVGTPQLLSMILSCPDCKVLDILNCFGTKGEPFGDALKEVLRKFDDYYLQIGRTYKDEHYRQYKERIHSWYQSRDDVSASLFPLSAHTFCYFLLSDPGSATVKSIRDKMKGDYGIALNHIRNDTLPSFTAHFNPWK